MRGNVGKNFENLPIFDILEKNIDKIPYLPDLNDKNKSKNMWNKIKHIFPEIKNDEDARSEVNFNAIAQYFNDALRFIIIPEILESEKRNKGAKVASVTINEIEAMYAAANPLAAWRWSVATNDANAMVISVYGSDQQDNKINAFKHSVWNAMGVQEMLQWGYSRDVSTTHAKNLACAHEAIISYCYGCPDKNNYSDNQSYAQAFTNYNMSWNVMTGNNNAMDLFNNLSGRTYTRNNTGWGLFGIRKWPSDDDIKNYFKNVADDSNKCLLKPTSSQIFSINSSVYSWYSLGAVYGAMDIYNDNESKLVRIQ